ncbi:hypothetical protein DFH06DRAFT_207625 [Mycena polygramma]|nr:hypothetical protein DFH06DRAFT_207625 [Mycena polygramma]
MPMSTSRAGHALPRELCDLVVDYLHAERAALGVCALVCRAWVPASRFHLFEHIALTEHTAYAAACLNEILASPHATLAPAVRSLHLFGALAPVRIAHPRTGRVQLKTLLEIVPRIRQFTHVRTLALSDLPFDLFSAFPRIRSLSLAGITAGPALLRLARCLPSLTHLTLKRVHAIPYRVSSPQTVSPLYTREIKTLRHITIRGSSPAFLGWLAVLAPYTRTLALGDLCPSEMPYLTAFLSELQGPLDSLELGLSDGTAVREFAWDELTDALGTGTSLMVCIDESRLEESQSETSEGERKERHASESALLHAQFADLERRGMLDVRWLTAKREVR